MEPVQETPISAAFSGTSLVCMESDMQIAVPLTLTGKANTPFTLVLNAENAETRRVLNLPVSVEVPIGATECVATLTITDDREVNPDRLCLLSITPSTNGVNVEPLGSVCEITVRNDDASIGFARAQEKIIISENDRYLLPIVLKGYQPQPVTVKVTLDKIDGVKLLDDGMVTISADTHMGYAIVELTGISFDDDAKGLAKLTDIPDHITLEREQTEVVNVSVSNRFTGKWNLFVPKYKDQKEHCLNRYIPAEITRLTTSEELKQTDSVEYQCAFNVNGDERVSFNIIWDSNLDKFVPLIRKNKFNTYNDKGERNGFVVFSMNPDLPEDIKINAATGIFTYYSFGTNHMTLTLENFDLDDLSKGRMCTMEGNICLLRPVEEDINPL